MKVLRANFPKSLTGVELVGFEDCPAGEGIEAYDVLVGAQVSGGGWTVGNSSVGDDRVALDPEKYANPIPLAKRRSFIGFDQEEERLSVEVKTRWVELFRKMRPDLESK